MPLLYLSPYEFMVHWTIEPAEHPICKEDSNRPEFHAKLTESGAAKLERQIREGKPENLEAGVDYIIKDKGIEDANWQPLPTNQYTEKFRHDWIY